MLSGEDLIKIFAKPGDLARKIHQKVFCASYLVTGAKRAGSSSQKPPKKARKCLGARANPRMVWVGKDLKDHLVTIQETLLGFWWRELLSSWDIKHQAGSCKGGELLGSKTVNKRQEGNKIRSAFYFCFLSCQTLPTACH